MPERKIELADIFRIHGPEYLRKFGKKMPPSHWKAMEDIQHCRTDYFGGHAYFCDDCDEYRYSFHSCNNRHCPKCGHQKVQKWLEAQRALLLPVPYFMATFTLHNNLRRLARSNQRLIYDVLFQTSFAALQKLAWDEEFVGGQIGMVGILQTWPRDLSVLHPHVHAIVPGLGLSLDGQQCCFAKENFLMPKYALSKIFRGKFHDELKERAPDLFQQIPPETWYQRWVVHILAVGTGERALEYLAPYIFQVAISNKRILKLEDGIVTFKFKHSKTQEWQIKSLPAERFIAAFLQHVLPRRFVKVRYYGFLNPQKRDLLQQAQRLLGVQVTERRPDNKTIQQIQTQDEPPEDKSQEGKPKSLPCPVCKKPMRWINKVKPTRFNTFNRARAP